MNSVGGTRLAQWGLSHWVPISLGSGAHGACGIHRPGRWASQERWQPWVQERGLLWLGVIEKSLSTGKSTMGRLFKGHWILDCIIDTSLQILDVRTLKRDECTLAKECFDLMLKLKGIIG